MTTNLDANLDKNQVEFIGCEADLAVTCHLTDLQG